jgi:hypothetical protein
LRLHAEDDVRCLRGQELRPRVRRLRQHGELRIVYAASNVRGWDAERRERVRLHAEVDGHGVHGEKLRRRLRRVRR